MRRGAFRKARSCGALVAAALAVSIVTTGAAQSLDAVALDDRAPVVDLTPHGERYEAAGRRLTIEPPMSGTAEIDSEIEEEATEIDEGALEEGTIMLSDGDGAGGTWFVFALRNRSAEPVQRYLVVDERGRGLGNLFWPLPRGAVDRAVTAGGRIRRRCRVSNDVDSPFSRFRRSLKRALPLRFMPTNRRKASISGISMHGAPSCGAWRLSRAACSR